MKYLVMHALFFSFAPSAMGNKFTQLGRHAGVDGRCAAELR